MMTEEQNKNKELCECYPFLLPRNVWTDKIPDDYDYSYIRGQHELPDGFLPLFYQMCEDIRQPLIDDDYLDKFRFTQIKEKYGSMRLYNHGAPDEVHDILGNYEYVSQFVCQRCGAPATYETTGWIASYCDDCMKECYDDVVPIEFDPIRKVTRFSNGETEHLEYDCSDIWRRLYAEK